MKLKTLDLGFQFAGMKILLTFAILCIQKDDLNPVPQVCSKLCSVVPMISENFRKHQGSVMWQQQYFNL
jgi:hypothetical protein